MPRVYTSDSHAPARSLRRAEVIGVAAALLLEFADSRKYTTNQLMLEVGLPYAIGQARVIRSDAGKPQALLSWAWLSEKTLNSLSQNPAYIMHVSELNEGTMLCISGIYRNQQERTATIAQFLRERPVHDTSYHLTDAFFGARTEWSLVDFAGMSS